MGKVKVTNADKLAYRNTPNGRKKYSWMCAGVIIDILSTLGIDVLITNAYLFTNPLYFYICLFILLVIVVLGGELIGVYFGAMEQYFYDKYNKKVLNIDE